MSNLLINEPPLMVLPTLAAKIGLNEAIILQQIHYWLDPRGNKNLKEGKHWVYNSYKDWEKQFPFWSEKTIKRAILALEKRGLLKSSLYNKNPLDKTKWYTINYSALCQLDKDFQRKGQSGPLEEDKVDHRKGQSGPLYNKDTETTTEKPSSLYPSSEKNLNDEEKRRREVTSLLKTNLEKPLKNIGSLGVVDAKSADDNNPQQMLQFWSETVGQGRQAVYLTVSRANALRQCLKKSFKDDLGEWKSYCLKIASSKFLMGETPHRFQAALDWCTRPQTIEDIFSGKFTLDTRDIPLSFSVPTDTETVRAIEIAETTLLEDIRSKKQSIPFKDILIKRIQFGFEGPERKKVLEMYGWERGGFSKLLETYISDMTFKAIKHLDVSSLTKEETAVLEGI